MIKKSVQISLALILIFSSKPIFAKAYGDTSTLKTFLDLVMYLIIFIVVIFVSLYGTKLVAKSFKGMTGSKYIKVLDAINIPGGSKIIITKVSNKIYILAISNSGVDILDIIDENEFPIIEEDVDSYISKYLGKDNLFYDSIKKKTRSNLDKFNRKKDKEDKKNEKQD